MARAEAASASTRNNDSIKGLAQSIAKPAYRRLLVAEPMLRRAVPVLVIVQDEMIGQYSADSKSSCIFLVILGLFVRTFDRTQRERKSCES